MAKWKSIAKNLYENGRYVEADEIARKLNAFDEMLEVFRGIANANYREWPDGLDNAKEFVVWAKSLSEGAIAKAEGK